MLDRLTANPADAAVYISHGRANAARASLAIALRGAYAHHRSPTVEPYANRAGDRGFRVLTPPAMGLPALFLSEVAA